jgi:hypothetical protein
MSPKTTPNAAKLKPASPIAETGLRFSAEILGTRISKDHSGINPTPVLELGSSLVDGESIRVRKIGAFHSPLDQVLNALDWWRRGYRKAPNSGQKPFLLSIALSSFFCPS